MSVFARFQRPPWITLFRALILVTVTFFIVRTLSSAREQLMAQQFSPWRLRPGWLVAAGLFYLAGLLPMGIYWYRLLQALGQRPTLGSTLQAYYVGHLGKYVPGKAMVVVLRAGLLRSRQIEAKLAAISVFAETLTMMAVGAFLAAAMLAWQFAEQRGLLLLALALMLLAGLPSCPPIFRHLVRRVKLSDGNGQLAEALRGMNGRLTLFGWFSNGVGWLLLTFSLWAVLRALPEPVELGPLADWLPRLTASVTLSVVAGFLSLLPGGIGVRELVLLELMRPFGQATAIVAAIVLRLIWLATELLVAAAFYAIFVWERRASGSTG